MTSFVLVDARGLWVASMAASVKNEKEGTWG